MSLKVENYIDFGTHGMFVCSITEAKVVSKAETMSYAYYHKNIKPQPQNTPQPMFTKQKNYQKILNVQFVVMDLQILKN